MTATPFTPYWRPVSAPAGPNSWVFFVVSRIAGRRRSVAVVSSVGDIEPEQSLQGYPLTACCRRVVTIFSDPANHTAIRAELNLAARHYVRDGGREHSLEPVELPEFSRTQSNTKDRTRPWDHTSVPEFPFIAACLLQGVAFDPQLGLTQPARPEPLGTVYRDTSIEWGMVVVDITDLHAVSYGIVGFTVCQAKFVPTLEAQRNPVSMGAMGPGVFERGELRVMDEVRPRRATSVAEYMAKFDYEAWPSGDAVEHLARTPLVDAAAMSLVWPPRPGEDIDPLPVDLSANTEKDSQGNQAVMKLIRESSNVDFDMSIFEEACAVPNFKGLLRHNLMENPHWLKATCLVGPLIRLAFTNHEQHLGLEQVGNITVKSIAAALEEPETTGITSLSLCIDDVWIGTPAQIIDVLSRVDSLREIYFLQHPAQDSDALSVELFAELAARPEMLSRVHVMFAGAYSAALRKRFWLPTTTNNNAVQLAPLSVFPVQQIFTRHQLHASGKGTAAFERSYVYLGDGLLRPKRFAAGFLLYLSTLPPSVHDDAFNTTAQLFAFSSGPASLSQADGPLSTTAAISPILAESFALPVWLPHRSSNHWPRARDLDPAGWTVLVSQEMPRGSATARYIRYALVRPRHRRILVDHPPYTPPGPEDLEVVGLKEFLRLTAPEIDSALVDRRLSELAGQIAAGGPYWKPLPPGGGVEALAVLGQAEAAQMLLEFLGDAREGKTRLREAMAECPGGEFEFVPFPFFPVDKLNPGCLSY